MSKAIINELTLVRLNNVQRLMTENEWTRDKFAARSGIKKATANTWLGKNGPNSNIGDKTAAKIEEGLSLTKGWLDRDRRDGGNDEAIPIAQQSTISINDPDVKVTEMPINKYQRDRIMEILFLDK